MAPKTAPDRPVDSTRSTSEQRPGTAEDPPEDDRSPGEEPNSGDEPSPEEEPSPGDEQPSEDERPAVELAEDATPMERYIAESVWPQWDQLREVRRLSSSAQMMNYALKLRKIRVRQVQGARKIFMYNGGVIGGMSGARSTSLVSAQAHDAAQSKILTKRYFSAAGLPHPRGKTFAQDEYPQAEIYFASLNRPGVVKPDGGIWGRGITSGVDTVDQLHTAWQHALDAQRNVESDQRRVLLEDQVQGLDLRAVVVGVHLVAAAVRVPLFVVGDGVSTVDELLQASIAHRKKHLLLHKRGVSYNDAQLQRYGVTRQTVLERGRLLVLSDVPNLYAGGLTVDVTDSMSEQLKELAISATWAVPGLRVSAVDLQAQRLDTAEGAEVLELDTDPDPLPHTYPAFGKYRKIASAIADELILEGAE